MAARCGGDRDIWKMAVMCAILRGDSVSELKKRERLIISDDGNVLCYKKLEQGNISITEFV